MAMSPRLLRPLASGFNPRQIAGLLMNIDASVLSSLRQNSNGTTAATATNDPVGYMEDLSGNGNHAKQTVATGSRPTLQLANQNGRPGLLFDGSNDFLTAAITGFQSLSGVTIVQVVKPTAAAAANANSALFWGWGNISPTAPPYPSYEGLQLGSATSLLSGETIAFNVEPGVANGRLGSSTYARDASSVQVLAATAGSSGTALYAQGSPVSLNLANVVTTSTATAPANIGYTVDDDLHIGAIRAAGSLAYTPELTLHQMLVYDRVLTGEERQKIEGWLAWRWGLQAQLPYDHPYAKSFPGFGSQATPTDADTLTYLAAVKAADGTGVEVGVANAVDDFVKGTKADGTWDSIKASCILAGARTLAGALVPLVGTAPTNNNFAEADYSRATGLVGDGSTTSLNTNRDNNADPQNDNHNALYITAANTNDPAVYMGSDGSGSAGFNQLTIASGAGAGTLVSASRNGAGASEVVAGGGNQLGFHGSSRASSSEYVVRVLGANTTHSRASVAPTSSDVHVFARGPTPAVFTDARIAFYSIGESLDLAALDARVTALITAIGAAI